MPAEPAVMNTAQFVKMAHGDVPWLQVLAADFFKEMQRLLPAWRTMFEGNNLNGLREELHRCKGGASIFGFERLVALLHACEQPMALETRGFDLGAFEHELAAAECALAAMITPGT